MTERKAIKSVFQEVLVKLFNEPFRGSEFGLPQGIVNYYSLKGGDALHCELVELRKEAQTGIQPIGKDILVTVEFRPYRCKGWISRATRDLYEIDAYHYALLKIKEVIRGR